jgi:hypothetical protein
VSGEIAQEICRLAAEMADAIEKEPVDGLGGFTFEMKASFVDDQPSDPVVFPVVLTFSADWEAGEWRRTLRQRLETMEAREWPRGGGSRV